jgi:hypothetical protein
MHKKIAETVKDLRDRAATCKAMAGKGLGPVTPGSAQRLLGKAAGYTHAAELLEALGERLEALEPCEISAGNARAERVLNDARG